MNRPVSETLALVMLAAGCGSRGAQTTVVRSRLRQGCSMYHGSRLGKTRVDCARLLSRDRQGAVSIGQCPQND
jgi:hypothetical protein